MRVSGSKVVLCLASTLLIVAVAGCGGGGGGGSDVSPIPINAAPTVTRVTPSQASVTLDVQSAQTMDFTVEANDPNGGNLTCIWTWDAGYMDPEESTVAAGGETTAKFTPPNYDYECTLRATVSDGELSSSVTWQVQVTGNEVGPSGKLRITAINVSPDPPQPSSAATMSAVVSNPGGQPLTYSWKTKYGSLSGSGSSVTWNTPADSGAYGIYVSVTDGTETASYGKAVTVSSGSSGGLMGQYYATERDKNVVRLAELRLTRIDPNVNFSWEKLSPDPSVPSNGFGARWTGYVKCEAAGDYSFRVHVDDGARMRIQNDAGEWIWVIPNTDRNWIDHTEGAWLPETGAIPLHLDGGKWYPIELEYFEGGTDAFITLYWSVNGGAEQIVPQASVKPPS